MKKLMTLGISFTALFLAISSHASWPGECTIQLKTEGLTAEEKSVVIQELNEIGYRVSDYSTKRLTVNFKLAERKKYRGSDGKRLSHYEYSTVVSNLEYGQYVINHEESVENSARLGEYRPQQSVIKDSLSRIGHCYKTLSSCQGKVVIETRSWPEIVSTQSRDSGYKIMIEKEFQFTFNSAEPSVTEIKLSADEIIDEGKLYYVDERRTEHSDKILAKFKELAHEKFSRANIQLSISNKPTEKGEYLIAKNNPRDFMALDDSQKFYIGSDSNLGHKDFYSFEMIYRIPNTRSIYPTVVNFIVPIDEYFNEVVPVHLKLQATCN